MISFFAIKLFWILLIVNQIVADQCVQKGPCECNYEDGYGYDLRGLDTPSRSYFETNSTSSPNITYLFHPCTDSTLLPDIQPAVKDNACNSGYAVI